MCVCVRVCVFDGAGTPRRTDGMFWDSSGRGQVCVSFGAQYCFDPRLKSCLSLITSGII